MALSVILAFLYIFAFPIANVRYLDSTIVCFLILFVMFCFNAKLRKKFFSIIFGKYITYIIIGWTIIVAYSVFIPTVKATYDFSIVKTLIHQLFALMAGVLLVAYLKIRNHKILDVVVISFIAQSILQIISLFVPSFREATNIFRSEATIAIQQRYGGIRGLAISGYAVFGLAVAYGLLFIIISLEWRNILVKVNIYLKLVAFLLLVVGTMSAGRTGLVGLGIAVVIRAGLAIFVEKTKIKDVLPVVCFAAISVCAVLILLQFDNILAIKYLSEYVNEFFKNFINGNGFTSTSTDKLWNMYFKIDPKTIMFGDGRYTEPDGAYYMHTDAGYMRNVLFFGVVGFALLFLYQLLIFDFKDKKHCIKSVIYMLFILLMHAKGEVLGFSIITQSILLLLNFSYNGVGYGSENIMLDGKL